MPNVTKKIHFAIARSVHRALLVAARAPGMKQPAKRKQVEPKVQMTMESGAAEQETLPQMTVQAGKIQAPFEVLVVLVAGVQQIEMPDLAVPQIEERELAELGIVQMETAVSHRSAL
jgi:hypothetical protein